MVGVEAAAEVAECEFADAGPGAVVCNPLRLAWLISSESWVWAGGSGGVVAKSGAETPVMSIMAVSVSGSGRHSKGHETIGAANSAMATAVAKTDVHNRFIEAPGGSRGLK